MQQSELTAQGLKVGWNNRAVAELESLSLKTGEIVVIAGPNGAGKSTILKTVARQIKPLSGSVSIDGADVATMEPQHFAQKLAYVPQLPQIPQHMTVKDLVSLGRNPHHCWWSWESTETDTKAISFALEQTEMTELQKRSIGDLSGGERQRAVIAMAVAQGTNFILLDEPTAHLDFKHQLHLVSLLSHLSSIGLGILLVLHDLNITARLANRVVLISRDNASDAPSKIRKCGSPELVFDAETLKLVYDVDIAIVRDAKTGFCGYFPTRTI